MARTTRSERILMGRIGAYVAHSRHDSRELTAAARQAFWSKFERDVDPEAVLDPAERARRADLARKAHFTRLALASVKARRRKKT